MHSAIAAIRHDYRANALSLVSLTTGLGTKNRRQTAVLASFASRFTLPLLLPAA